jgi:two-component system sensor histidine kinase VicK
MKTAITNTPNHSLLNTGIYNHFATTAAIIKFPGNNDDGNSALLFKLNPDIDNNHFFFSDFGLWHLIIHTKELYVNEQCKKIYGLSRDSCFTLRTFFKCLPKNYRKQTVKFLSEFLVSGSPFDIEFPIFNSLYCENRWVRVKGHIILNHDGYPQQLTGLIEDITARKHREHCKEELVAILNHELRTPLTLITVYLQTIQRLSVHDEKTKIYFLKKSDEQVRFMTQMTEDFLGMSALQSGQLTFNLIKINLKILLQQAILKAAELYTEHKFAITDAASIWILADNEKISQAVNNYISNAVKYSPKNSSITVDYRINNNTAIVSVKDEGIGISNEDLGKVFDRYHRVNNRESNQVKGFGIGLYYVKMVINGHCGDVWVNSKPDQGSEFCFSLPCKNKKK